jgi:uncharacterized protein (TIGR00369 family)
MCPETIDEIQADADYSTFFLDEEFQAKYPDVKLPPPSFISSGAKILSFDSGKSILLAFPVREDQANPIGTLQGGVLCSFFDDAFGSLSFASLRKPCISIDMTVNFIRPARPGEFVKIRAEFKARNRKLLQLYAEAHNGRDKLLATATSNLMVYEQ